MKISKIITVAVTAIAIAATTIVTTSGFFISGANAQQTAPQSTSPSATTTTTTNDDDDDDDNTITAPTPPPTTTTTTPANMTSTTTTTAVNASSANKTFYLFNDEVDEDLDDDGGGIQGQGQGFTGDDDIDIYSLQTMVVNIGDMVTIQFFNVDDDDDTPERHSFTMGAPYNIDADMAGGESTVVTFTASSEGVFQYYSKYNMPQMTGQLVVLP